jgi:DNA modification methylase
MSKPYYQDDICTIYHGDCLDVLPTLESQSIDLVLTDPPYGVNLNVDNSRFSGGHNASKRRQGSGTSRYYLWVSFCFYGEKSRV